MNFLNVEETERETKECTTAAAVVRVLGGKFLEVHTKSIIPPLFNFEWGN